MKVPWWSVPLIGFLVAALGSGAIFYFAIRPQQEKIRQLEEKIRQEEQVIAQREKAEKDYEEAKKEAEKARLLWRRIRNELAILRWPDPDDPRAVWLAGISFQRESQGYFERDLRKFLADLANRCKVDLTYASVPQFVMASLQMPTLPSNGYFRWGQMTLQVDGRFADILRFLEGLPQFSRPIVDGLVDRDALKRNSQKVASIGDRNVAGAKQLLDCRSALPLPLLPLRWRDNFRRGREGLFFGFCLFLVVFLRLRVFRGAAEEEKDTVLVAPLQPRLLGDVVEDFAYPLVDKTKASDGQGQNVGSDGVLGFVQQQIQDRPNRR